MRGIAFINDDMYYERDDGTYAKMPYDDPKGVADILNERATDDELVRILRTVSSAAKRRGPKIRCGIPGHE